MMYSSGWKAEIDRQRCCAGGRQEARRDASTGSHSVGRKTRLLRHPQECTGGTYPVKLQADRAKR